MNETIPVKGKNGKLIRKDAILWRQPIIWDGDGDRGVQVKWPHPRQISVGDCHFDPQHDYLIAPTGERVYLSHLHSTKEQAIDAGVAKFQFDLGVDIGSLRDAIARKKRLIVESREPEWFGQILCEDWADHE